MCIFKTAYVYILASKRNGDLYVAVSTDLQRCVYEHSNGSVAGYTRKYPVHRLVYYESSEDLLSVITREKQLKKWNRKWKLALIEKDNPEWRDLYEDIL